MWGPGECHQGEHQCCAVDAAGTGGCLTSGEGAGESAKVGTAGTKAGGIISEYKGDGKGIKMGYHSSSGKSLHCHPVHQHCVAQHLLHIHQLLENRSLLY